MSHAMTFSVYLFFFLSCVAFITHFDINKKKILIPIINYKGGFFHLFVLKNTVETKMHYVSYYYRVLQPEI
jgi:hypothetical protein